MIWQDADLHHRLACLLRFPASGYRHTAAQTPRFADAIRAEVRAAVGRILQDEGLALLAADRFIGSLACDDLDALSAACWPAFVRRRSFVLQGAAHLPRVGPAIFVSLHMGGGFRIFDTLVDHGFRPAFLRQPFVGSPSRYVRTIESARAWHFRRRLVRPVIAVGSGARAAIRTHLEAEGSLVALLDVAPEALGLQDRAETEFLGRPVELGVGLMRLAVEMKIPVIPYDGRMEDHRRVLTLHAPQRAEEPSDLLRQVMGVLEQVVRKRPWDWQGWLDAEDFFSAAAPQ